MKKEQKGILLGIILLIACIATLSIIRSWRMSQVEAYLVDAELVNGLLEEVITYDYEKYLVQPSDIYESTELPVINDPKFDSVTVADSYLADNVEGIDIEINGEHRFYSYQILNWHETVNSSFDKLDLSITHCALCKSSAVYESTLNGKNLDLKNSGKVYNNNQLLESKDGTLWLQLRGTAISGKQTGDQLTEYPFQVMTWNTWKELYPNGFALSNDTGYTRDYGMHPYQNYDTAKIIYYPLNKDMEYMAAKWEVEGLEINGEAIAFADTIMLGKMVANEIIGGVNLSAFWHEELNQSIVFFTNTSNEALTFTYDWDTETMKDDQTNSLWNASGFSVSGELAGTQLTRIQTKPTFWMCWNTQYTDTKIAHVETETTTNETE